MNLKSAICPSCQTVIPTGAPGGSCPSCLLKLGLADSGFAAVDNSGIEAMAPSEPVGFPSEYQILSERPKRGGMGIVYKALQRKLDRPVAIKMMLPELFLDEDAIKQFYSEARIAAALQHTNIVSVHEIGEHAGRHYFSMEFVEGLNLAEMADGKPLHPIRAAAYLKTIAEALDYAHRKGVVHCDLKPQNILIDQNDQPKITDFGLARLVNRTTRADNGVIRGTPNYMSPEQALGNSNEVRPASDIYSLGSVFYEMLTGRPPFMAPSRDATLWAIRESLPLGPRKLNPAVPQELEEVCLKCLEKSPALRYESAQALADDLGRRLASHPTKPTNAPFASIKRESIPALSTSEIKLSRESLVRWSTEIATICREEKNFAAAATVEKAATEYAAGRFTLCIIGMAKRGKSTLINALLGQSDSRFAPVDKLPATSVATRFSWAGEYRAEVNYRDGTKRIIDVSEIPSFVTEEGNPENGKNVSFVNVEGPFSDLSRRLTLIDLPGLGSIHEHHNQILFEFLPLSDAVLLLTTARMPVNEEELELLRAVKKEDVAKLFVAINKTDVTSAQELSECEQHNRRQLQASGISVNTVHRFSALQALRGDWDGSGLSEFTRDLASFLDRESGRIMAEKLKREVIAAATPPLQALAAGIAVAGKSAEEIARERESLSVSRKAALQDGERNEKTFSRNWISAIGDAELGLSPARDRVRARMAREIDGAGLLQISALVKSMPRRFNKVLEAETAELLTTMENRLSEACQVLETGYPRIELLGGGIPQVTTPVDGAFTKGFLGGSALVAGGAGMAAAASSAIAAAAVTTTVVAPGAAAVASFAGIFSSGLASFVSGLGTSTVAAAAPSALLIAAGPIGLTLAGIGALAVPLTWRLSQKRKQNDIAEQVDRQVDLVFRAIREERLPALRSFGPRIVEEFRASLERRIGAIDEALAQAGARAGQVHDNTSERQRFERLSILLSRPTESKP